jgi:hypothetical protein
LAYVFEQIVDEQRVELVEEDEKPVLVDEAYSLDNKTPDKDLVRNEIVLVVVVVAAAEELILDLKVFRQCSKYKNMTLINMKENKELTLISNNCNEICCEY